MPLVDLVLFDYGGVLCPAQGEGGRAELAAMSGLSLPRLGRLWAQYRPSYDLGIIDGREYWSRLLRHSRIPLVNGLPERLVAAEIESWLAVDEALLSWAGRLRDAGIGTGVLSNMPIELADDTCGRPWISGFAPRIFSAQIHKLKPYAPIYEHAVEQSRLPPERILFLDDRDDNARGAIRSGLRAIQYRGLSRIAAEVAALGLSPP